MVVFSILVAYQYVRKQATTNPVECELIFALCSNNAGWKVRATREVSRWPKANAECAEQMAPRSFAIRCPINGLRRYRQSCRRLVEE